MQKLRLYNILYFSGVPEAWLRVVRNYLGWRWFVILWKYVCDTCKSKWVN